MTDFNDVLFKRTEPAQPSNVVPMPAALPGDALPYATKALAEEADNVASAAPGTRNHTLNVAAYNLGQLVGAGHLSPEVVTAQLHRAALAAGLEPGEILPTIRSGMTDGAKQPRQVAEAVPTEIPAATVLQWTPPQSDEQPRVLTPEEQADLQAQIYAQRLAAEVHAQRLRREARRQLEHEDAVAAFRVPPSLPTLTQELELPDPPIDYAVDELLPAGGNVLLTAAFKTGKTTLVNNLARSWADGIPFLGKFDVRPEPGRTVALFNYEVDDRQYRRWLRDAQIRNTDNVVVLNLRAHRLPLTVPFVEEWVVGWLQEHNVGMWIVDPFARAFAGCGDENSNSDVAVFLDALDVIKGRAGVRDLVLTAHTGRAEQAEGQERARGATRLDDWPDVRWLLVKDAETGSRYFRATGRDVEVDEERLSFDDNSRLLTFGGGDRKWDRKKADSRGVAEIVNQQPGITAAALRDEVCDRLHVGKARADAAIKTALYDNLIRRVEGGPGQPIEHYPIGVHVLSMPGVKDD